MPARPNLMAWSLEDEDDLYRLRAKGLSWSAIERKLKRSRTVCRNRWFKAAAQGLVEAAAPSPLPGNLWTPEEVQRVVDMRTQGLQWCQIAHHMGKTAASVRTRWVRAQRPRRPDDR